ncbi:hypothetical protein AB4Y77_21360 [Paenarthrobacter sp. YAF11_1]
MALRYHAVQHNPDFTEVHSASAAGACFLPHERLRTTVGLNVDLGRADPHVDKHRRIRQLLRATFLDQ